jgi:hypothetical protein
MMPEPNPEPILEPIPDPDPSFERSNSSAGACRLLRFRTKPSGSLDPSITVGGAVIPPNTNPSPDYTNFEKFIIK